MVMSLSGHQQSFIKSQVSETYSEHDFPHLLWEFYPRFFFQIKEIKVKKFYTSENKFPSYQILCTSKI